jgi:hypothetical protein
MRHHQTIPKNLNCHQPTRLDHANVIYLRMVDYLDQTRLDQKWPNRLPLFLPLSPLHPPSLATVVQNQEIQARVPDPERLARRSWPPSHLVRLHRSTSAIGVQTSILVSVLDQSVSVYLRRGQKRGDPSIRPCHSIWMLRMARLQSSLACPHSRLRHCGPRSRIYRRSSRLAKVRHPRVPPLDPLLFPSLTPRLLRRQSCIVVLIASQTRWISMCPSLMPKSKCRLSRMTGRARTTKTLLD